MPDIGPVVYLGLLSLLALWAAFWLIRLAVRYGVDDALQRNPGWLDRDPAHGDVVRGSRR
jgi:hypothetical protein